MPNLLRNALAIVAGVVVGGAVNMALIMISPAIIPPPAGVDVSDPESLARSIHLFGPQHFVMPFLAHALGTLVGATVAWLVAGSRRTAMAMAIGFVFLVGGGVATLMIPAPVWFVVLDLVVAYLPMAWVGARIGERIAGRNAARVAVGDARGPVR